MVEGIIIAAGLSSRANTFKMTLPFNNKSIIECAIDNMLSVCSRIVLVGGYKIENLINAADKYKNVELVFNEEYESGMFSSILKGMSHIRKERFFFTLGDYPIIDPEVYSELLKHDGNIVIPSFEGKKGHPVLFKRCIIDEVKNPNRYSSLRNYIREKNPVLVPVNCRGILMDVDTIEDYKRLVLSMKLIGQK